MSLIMPIKDLRNTTEICKNESHRPSNLRIRAGNR